MKGVERVGEDHAKTAPLHCFELYASGQRMRHQDSVTTSQGWDTVNLVHFTPGQFSNTLIQHQEYQARMGPVFFR